MNDQGRIVFEVPDSAGEARVAAAGRTDVHAGELPVFGERQLREFENSPRAMCIFDRSSLRYLAVNDAALQLYGYSREELLGLTVKDTRHPDEHAIMLANIAEPAGLLMNFGPHRHIRKSGEIIMVEVIAQDVLFKGRPARVTLTMDVTERVRVMALARQREQEFETLADNLPDLVARYSRSRRFVYVNRAIEMLLGVKREAVLGRTQREIGLPESLIALYDASIAQALVSGQAHTLEFSLPTVAGDERLFEAYHVPERDAAGNIVTVLCVGRDITQRKKSEDELRDSKARFELAVDNTGLGMWDWNVRTGKVWRHARWAQLLGYEPAEVPGDIGMWRELCHPDDWAQAQEKLLAHFAGKTPMYESEYRMHHKAGSWIWIRCRGKIVERNEAGEPLRMIGYIRDMTERKMIEEALLESREQFRAVTETANDAIVSVDSEGRIVYFNQAAAKIFGYSVAEAMGEPLTLLMPERVGSSRRDCLRAFLKDNSASMVGKTVELIGRCKDGTEFPAELSLASWRTNSGAFFTGIVRDLTNRKQREVLQSSLAAIVNNSADAIISNDLDGVIRTWNPGAERLFGYRADEVIGQSIMILSPADRGNEEGIILQRIRRGERTENFESIRRKKNGALVDVSLTISPVRDVAGRVVGASTIVRDITERTRSESALRESEERFRQLAENIREVFWISTPASGEVIYVSPAYEEIWGKTRDSLYRNPGSWRELIHPEDLAGVRAAQMRMPGGEHTDVEYRIVRPDGTTRWIRDRSYPMTRGDGTPLVCGIAEDVTEQKRAEEERLTHAIHQRDALVREVHHRIKNHLQGIAGLLRNKAQDDPAARETIEAAVAQLQSVAVVYGLQSELAESGVPLCRVLEAICSSAEGLSGARIVRAFAADTGAIRLAATEAVPIAVALNELVFNAIEHGHRRGGPRRIEVALSENADGADVRIVNPGKLSARFDYARGIGTGTGLDLVKTLLGPSGGELRFDARKGTVEVNLGLRPPLVAARRRQAPAGRIPENER